VLSSGFRRGLTYAVACLLWGGLCAPGVAMAEEGDDLAAAINAHIHERLPSSAPPMTPADENRITSFSRYILKTFYYPANTRDLKAAALAAIDAIEPPLDTATLVQAAVAGVVNSLGHGARLLTTIGGDAGSGSGGTASTRQVGSVRVVALPTMNIGDPNVRRTCADFVQYFDPQNTDGLGGVVLDLRGNEGGPLTDSSCLIGFFIKSGQTVFQVTSKQGTLVKYETEANGHKPLSLPVAVLIDNHTDSGALLVAAVLQSQRHATVLGEQKPNINGAVSSLVFPPGANRGVVLPTGEILLNDKRPLAAAFHADLAMASQDDTALLNAAGAYLAKQK
jgi:hypothetical protein